MALFHLKDDQYLLHLKRKYSFQEFCHKAKVLPGTYSASFVQRIFSLVFDFSENLVDEYRRYYSNEYENIDKFLFWRYGISEDIINQLRVAEKDFLVVFPYIYYTGEEDIFWQSIKSFFNALEENEN